MTAFPSAPVRRLRRILVPAVLVAVTAAGVSSGRASAAGPVPACTKGDAAAPLRGYDEWASTMLDTRFRVSRAYVPPGLVSTTGAGTNGGYRVRSLVIADLRAMVAGARRAGVSLRVTSGYRSYDAQLRLYRYYVDRLGPIQGALRAARPGHSEHQLGTALDLANTRGAYAWIARSAWRYGFVVSYPSGETSRSCYRYEPWHVRYFGRARAAAIHASGLVARVWLWRHVVGRAS